jgi:methylenetetrahydrofolate--tRNA-(uracil-5-)-methyltransferase
MPDLIVIGGGLAGCEAAWQAAERGLNVELFEMRPSLTTGAHETDYLAELVCSNSLGSKLPDRASGILKNELRRLGSMLLECAEACALPAGAALAVDRDLFSRQVTDRILDHPHIRVIRKEVTEIPEGLCIVASGPLTSPSLSQNISEFTGEGQLFFFDAIAPIVSSGTINMGVAFRASRYDQGGLSGGDYINCPFTRDEYYIFVEALLQAEKIELRSFEEAIKTGVKAGQFFEGCLPVEIIAGRGKDSLAFGPMRPIGLRDPRTGKRPFAVLQLRQDDLAGSLYNLVGFQTNLKYPEQKRVFRMVPGLEKAEFMRYGQMHRNTFISSPNLLLPTLQFIRRENLLFSGQITGVEGYMGNIATGLLAGINAARIHRSDTPLTLPQTTMLGALCHYISHAHLKDFQPMKANFGILSPLDGTPPKGKFERAKAYADRALNDLDDVLSKEKVQDKHWNF